MKGFYATLALAGFACLAIVIAAAHAETISVSPPTTPQIISSTVANLPTCNAAAAGRLYLVTNALLPASLATVVGGGIVVVPVVCNGAGGLWIVA